MEYKNRFERILEEHRKVYETLDLDQFIKFKETMKSYHRIFTIGVGREGMATRAFAMRLMHMGKEVHWIWDDTTPAIGEGDLLIATMGGGDIGHIRYVCEQAKAAGAYILVVTGSPGGLASKDLPDQIIFVPAAVYRGRDQVVPSIQPMGNLFEQCLFIIFDICIMELVDEIPGMSFEKMSRRHRNVE